MSFTAKLKELSADTLFRGFFCGLTAGILKDFIDYILFSLKAKEVVFWNFASMLAFHKRPQGFLMHSTALILELIFCALVAFIFILVAQQIKSRHYALLGILYGSLIWFFIKGVIVACKIEELKPTTIANPLYTWILSMLFGLIVSLLDRGLSPKTS